MNFFFFLKNILIYNFIPNKRKMYYCYGNFICSKCKSENSLEYGKWIKRQLFINNILTYQWIFYDKSSYKLNKYMKYDNKFMNYLKTDSFYKYFYNSLNKGANCDCCCKCNDDCCFYKAVKVLYLIFGVFIFFLLYFIIFIWIDLVRYFCYIKCKDKRKKIYVNAFGKDCDWSTLQWKTEIEINNENIKFTCKICHYYYENFKDCIPKKYIENDNNSSKEVIIGITEKESIFNKDTDIIAINFISVDNIINYYCIPCKKSDIFKSLITKLFEKFPEYKKKDKIFFVANGDKIDENKTVLENKIKNGDIIILNYCP